MRGVDVVRAAAVGAEFLDGFLAGDGAAGDGLACSGRSGDRPVMRPGLDRPGADEDDGDHKGDGQQNADGDTRQVDPEVAQPIAAATGEAAYQRDRYGDTDGCRHEVLDGQSGGLRRV